MKQIQKAAVLGAGVMGAGIAAHLVNAGLDVVLLDLEIEKNGKKVNLADLALMAASKAKPSPIFTKSWLSRIRTGSFQNDLALLEDRDWVIEVVKEDLAIKHKLYESINNHVPADAILTTNTSGIPIHKLSEVFDEARRKRFFGTHFFNPPRYMKLLEVIPGPDTDPQILKDFQVFGESVLGKGVVFAKDCPNFIANRIGIQAMMAVFHAMADEGLTIEEVDKLLGSLVGHPKTAIFRLADLVGLDTFAHVADNLYEAAPEDECREMFKLPDYVRKMVDGGILGDKSGSGFYKKVREGGNSVILSINFETMEYEPKKKPNLPTLDIYKNIEDLGERMQKLALGKDKVANFVWRVTSEMLVYAVNRIGEVADDIANIDRALRWGFNWEMGPFETWDALGIENVVKRLEKEGRDVPALVKEMLAAGHNTFYKRDGSQLKYFNLKDAHVNAPERPNVLVLKDYKNDASRIVKSNKGASLVDMGDGVLLLEFHSKMNTIGGDAIGMVQQAVKLVEENYEALVVGNQGGAFSAGANLMLLLLEAQEGNFEDIDMMIRGFQNSTTSLRYCKKPVVAAPFGLTLGGGCEFSLHADAIQASSETYMGLVEVGVGLIPAGAGTKEMLLRHIGGAAKRGETNFLPVLQKLFETIGMGKVSTSAEEAREMGFLTENDGITMNGDALLLTAKNKALALARAGYEAPKPVTDIPVLGEPGFAALKLGLYLMHEAGYISDHDKVVGTHLARILTGGNLTPGGTMTESHVLDLEREAFLRLCGERKTLERIQHMLKTGKPLRN